MAEPKDEDVSFREGIRALWSHLRSYKLEMGVLAALGLISAGANGALPYILGRFFDALIALAEGNAAVSDSLPLWLGLLLLYACIQVVANGVDWLMGRMSRRVEVDIQVGLQARGFVHLLRLPLSFHKNERVSQAINAFDQASWRVKFVFNTIVDVAPQLLSVAVGIVFAFTIHTFLASILLTGAVLYIIVLFIMLRSVGKMDADVLKTWNQTWGDAASAVYQIESVKQAVAEPHEIKKIESTYFGDIGERWRKLQYIWNDVNFLQHALVFATQLLVFVFSVGFIVRGEITVGELVTLNGYAQLFFGPFFRLGYNWEIFQNGLNAAKRAQIIFDAEQETYEPDRSVKLPRITGRVEFDAVSFSYDAKDGAGLQNVTFAAAPGEIVALVGESGVGKSTAVSLISGYYFPTAGAVRIDGADTRELPLEFLRRHIAVVPQEVALFNDTIGNNIKYGTFGASKRKIREAAEKAHIADFIEGLPDKYETLVGERGMKLSVGQKQRVAIARAILRDPAILILDEPTSALDAKTERLLSESLEELMRGRTTFIIAHRLSTVRKAEKILVFQGGKIVETGTHDELIELENGVYRKLYEYQIGLH